jgi:diguanylate cyclase (GGDEF)-like protein/PAS domain S-box-containing protein
VIEARSNTSEAGFGDPLRVRPAKIEMTKWLMLALALAVASLATLSIVTLQQRSDASRQAEVLVAHVESLTNRLKRLELQAESDQVVPPELAAQAQQLRTEINQSLYDLVRLDRRGMVAAPVVQAFDEYQAANEELFLLIAANRLEEAHEWDEERSDPAYDVLFDRTASASAAYRAAAQRASTLATTGSLLTMAVAALALGLLFLRFERARSTAALLANEQQTLRRSEEQFRSLVRNASDVILIVDPQGTIRYESPAVEWVWGYPLGSFSNRALWDFVHTDDLLTARGLLDQAMADATTITSTEVRLQYADGTWHDFEVIASDLQHEPGINGIVVTFHNITDRKAFERAMLDATLHDSLTRLPNRILIEDRLEQALARAEQHQWSVAVLALDLDNFKIVNESLDHHMGDRLLCEVAERLCAAVRPEDTVARLGGDEFVVVLEAPGGVTDAVRAAEQIAHALQAPFVLDEQEVFVSASIGIVLGNDGKEQAERLLRNADLAMYRAKTNGKSCYAVFEQSMTLEASTRLQLESDLRRALERDEFRMYYQPIAQLDTGVIDEVEALVRWEHPRRGLVPPADFIPVAEETGLILPLGRWVLRQACQQMRTWQNSADPNLPRIVSVNLSARQFGSPQLVADVAQVLRDTGLDPSSLKLEITESVMMQDVETTSAILHQLKQLGVKLAIDDFGTGYSSLAYLQRFPIDVLKIDRSFVRPLGNNPEDDAIVRTIITLAKTLNMVVTGEGIETTTQLQQLRALGCDLGQGYYIARPEPSNIIDAKIMEANQQVASENERLVT